MQYKGHGRWSLHTTPSTAPAPKRMKKITYKPEYDEPEKKKPAKKKKPVRKKTTTANTKSIARPKKQLPPMKKPGWFW